MCYHYDVIIIVFHLFSIDGYVCWVHSISDGVVVLGNNITLEFEGTGRGADDDDPQYECVLRGPQKDFIKNCKAPICRLSQSIVSRVSSRILCQGGRSVLTTKVHENRWFVFLNQDIVRELEEEVEELQRESPPVDETLGTYTGFIIHIVMVCAHTGVSPVTLSGLLPGQYKLRIRRNDTMNNCVKNKWKAFSFTIQE